MANRPTIGTEISNNRFCSSCEGTYCPPGGSCWERFYRDGQKECTCILNFYGNPNPNPGNPGGYDPKPGWSIWGLKDMPSSSSSTIIISTTNEEIQIGVDRISEIQYVAVNGDVKSITFPAFSEAQRAISEVMNMSNIEPPSIIGLIPSTKSARRIPIKVIQKYCGPCTSPLKAGCCGNDECWYMNGYKDKFGVPQIGFMCRDIGIQSWPREESIAQLNISPFETQLQSSTMKNYLTEQKCVQTKNAAGQLIEKCS